MQNRRIRSISHLAVVSMLLLSCSGCFKKQEAVKVFEAEVDVEKFHKLEFEPYGKSIKSFRKKLYAETIRTLKPPAETFEIPFVLFKSGEDSARVSYNFEKQFYSLQFLDGKIVNLPKNQIPSGIISGASDTFFILSRSYPSNQLNISIWDDGLSSAQLLKKSDTGYLFYRAGLFKDGNLNLVVYDNDSAKNYVWIMRAKKDGLALTKEVELPTLEDPAGTHYEMEPRISLFALDNGSLSIIGGTLDAALKNGKLTFSRLSNCIRILESVQVKDEIYKLCDSKNVASDFKHLLYDGKNNLYSSFILPEGVPFNLRVSDEGSSVVWDIAKGRQSFADLFEFDFLNNQESGIFEIGINNIEGRIPWSQVYYLNGLLDAIQLAGIDDRAFEIFYPMIERLYQRIYFESLLLAEQINGQYALKTRAFTKGREDATFAVQSGRILLLLNRMINELGWKHLIPTRNDLANQVISLKGHIDVLAFSDNSNDWLEKSYPFLKWPKGSAFYYDGAPVPYNHQNEWAYSVIDHEYKNKTHKNSKNLVIPGKILEHFTRHLMPGKSSFPKIDKWFYWWGKGFDGWATEEEFSVNTPNYVGDKSAAWISFRTIDLTSILSGIPVFNYSNKKEMLASAKERVTDGDVYPFAANSLLKNNVQVSLKPGIAFSYVRARGPWEFANFPWALTQAVQFENEDPNSKRLNSKVKIALPGIASLGLNSAGLQNYLKNYFSIAVPYNTNVAISYAGEELGGKYLAWNLAYDLRALLLAFESYGDESFLKLFVSSVNKVILIRDDKIGIVDDIRGRPAKSWGSNRYSKDKKQWVAWDAFGGMVVYPMLKYCNIEKRFRLQVEEVDLCGQYVAEALETLAEYDVYWRVDEKSGAGHYYDPVLEDIAPLNHANTLGLAYLEAYKATGKNEYKLKAEAMAKFFKSHWKVNSEDIVSWEYWAGAEREANRSTQGEDLTHAQINVHFAYECYKQNIVFNKQDMLNLTKTLRDRIIKKDGTWAQDLDGSGDALKSLLHEGILGWSILAEFDKGLISSFEKVVRNNPTHFPLGWFSYATGPIGISALKKISK